LFILTNKLLLNFLILLTNYLFMIRLNTTKLFVYYFNVVMQFFVCSLQAPSPARRWWVPLTVSMEVEERLQRSRATDTWTMELVRTPTRLGLAPLASQTLPPATIPVARFTLTRALCCPAAHTLPCWVGPPAPACPCPWL